MIKPGDFVIAKRNTSNLVVNDFYDVLAITISGDKAYIQAQSIFKTVYLESLQNLEKP